MDHTIADTGGEYYDPDLTNELMRIDSKSQRPAGTATIIPMPATGKLIQTSTEFVAGFVSPDYLIDGIIIRGFLYSLTANTGGGKTAEALLFAAHVDKGKPIGAREIAKGRVLYFAGENSTDVRMRWLATTHQFALEPEDFDVRFVDGGGKLSGVVPRIRREVGTDEYSLIIIDTSAAYFDGDEENNNTQALAHAKRMRELTKLPGNPAVLACCHPVKNATEDNLLPRGGGAFLNEMDGNLTSRKNDLFIEMHWQGKFRGPEFSPMTFQLKIVTHPRLVDSKGRLMPTVVAVPLSEEGQMEMAALQEKDEDQVLLAIADNPRGSLAEYARTLGWALKDQTPNKMRVQRATKALARHKLVTVFRNVWKLTPEGENEKKRIKAKAE
jgi:hypothetical protein